MAYEKQNFVNGDVLDASQLNAMDNQIALNESGKISNPSGGVDGYVLTYTEEGIAWKNPKEESSEEIIASETYSYNVSSKLQKTVNVSIEKGQKYKIACKWNTANDFTGVTIYYNGLDLVLERFYPTNENEYVFSGVAQTDITSLVIYIAGSNVKGSGTLEFNVYIKKDTVNVNSQLIALGFDIESMMNRASKTPIATWIDDDTNSQLDGYTYGIEAVKSVADTLGIKATFGCITNVLSNEALKNRLLEYQKEGFHIVSHSDTHTKGTESVPYWYPAQYTDVNICEQDLVESLVKLQTNGFLNSDYFVVPGGNSDEVLSRMITRHCKCSVMADYHNGINHVFGEGRAYIHRIFIRPIAEGGYDLATYKAKIDEAYSNGDWIVFGTHSGNDAQWDETLINSVLSYAKTKGFQFETLHSAWNIRKYNYDLYDMFS